MPSDGISRLITVTQLKGENANNQAVNGASKQRDLIGKQQTLRAVQRTYSQLTRAEKQSAMTELQMKLGSFRKTLSASAAALLDQWLEWAAQHR